MDHSEAISGRRGATPDQVEAMHQAWVKAVLLQLILWSHPYVREGDLTLGLSSCAPLSVETSCASGR